MNKPQFKIESLEIDTSNPLAETLSYLIHDGRAIVRAFLDRIKIEEDMFYHMLFDICLDKVFAAFESDKDLENAIFDKENLENNQNLAFNKLKSLFPLKIQFSQANLLGILLMLIDSSLQRVVAIQNDFTILHDEAYQELILDISRTNASIVKVINEIELTNIILKTQTVNIHEKGAAVRKAKFEEKKKEAKRLFDAGNYYSYAAAARDIYEEIGVTDPATVARWLSQMSKK